jgi:RND family efflux transporter MFP subunit
MASNRIISLVTRAIVVIVLLLISISIVAALVNTKPQLAEIQGVRSLPAVVVFQASEIPMQRHTVGYGTADAMQHADIPAEVSSTVTVLPPTTRVGRRLSKGDLIVELDSTDFKQKLIRAQQSLSSAKSSLSLLSIERDAAQQRSVLANQDKVLAEAEFLRVKEAFAKGAAKQREVDATQQKLISVSSLAVNATESANRFPAREEQASTQVTSKEADVAIARENVRRCKVVSPISGVLQAIDVRVGEHVSTGKRIARVINSETVEIPLRLPSYARSFVRIGDGVALRSAGFGKRRWNSRISRIAPEDDTNSRTMIVYIDINQSALQSDEVPPGLFLRGEVKSLQDSRARWVVPRRSIREDRIYVVRDGIVRSIPVAIEYSVTGELPEFELPDQDWAVLETLLNQGDTVVVDPGGSLRDGMRVRSILSNEVTLE